MKPEWVEENEPHVKLSSRGHAQDTEHSGGGERLPANASGYKIAQVAKRACWKHAWTQEDCSHYAWARREPTKMENTPIKTRIALPWVFPSVQISPQRLQLQLTIEKVSTSSGNISFRYGC